MKFLRLFLILGALVLGLAACGGANDETSAKSGDASSAAGTEEFTITATNWDFASDKELVVKKGTKVKLNLVNKEGFHTIKNDELKIDLGADKPAEFTANKTGEFELYCSTVCGPTDNHEAMKITLKVEE